MPDRWYVSGPLGVGTAFDEPTDTQSVAWSNIGTAIRHNVGETLNLLDSRAAAVNQGPSLNLWGLNAGTPPRAVRLGAVSARFVTTPDGGSTGALAFSTKGTGGDVSEAMRISERQYLGIGTQTPNARLSVVAPGTTEVAGTAASTTLRTSSGSLVATVSAELPLATFGFSAGTNNTSLGIRARRAAAGSDWTTTAVGLGVDVDNTVRVNGNGLWLLANANVGIGTMTPGARLDVSGSGGVSQCCAPVLPTLALSEASTSAARRAWLQFHNSGEAEAYIRLTGGGAAGSGREGQRRLEIGDSQGAGTGLSVIGDVAIGGNLSVAGKNALRGTDSWLRLNQDGNFGSGVHTPGVLAPGSLNVGGRGGWANPGNGNAWIAGSLTIDGTFSAGGEVYLRANRSSITGFDGGGRQGYHWIHTDGDDNEMWFAFGQAWPNRPDIPRRVECAVPLWAPVVRQTSDARLKSDVRPLADALSRVAALRGVSYTRLPENGGKGGIGIDQREIGVIAQEVEHVFPELVAGGGSDHYLTVDYAGLTSVLLEAVKGLSDAAKASERRIELLENQLAGAAS